mgnify:CR=1 FL=1
MISKELLDNIDIIRQNLKKFHNLDDTSNEMILAKAVKLSEEVWELNSEVLKSLYKGRKIFVQEDLELEFADVILTTLLLAKSLNVDINSSLVRKLNIIKERWWV